MNNSVANNTLRKSSAASVNSATPGRLTALAAMLAALSAPAFAVSDVVISQVYGGGGNSGSVFKNDFIELFNRSAAPVALNGWSVQYASATGTSWQVTALPAVTLQPGQYLLVQQAAGAAGTQALPTPDKIGTIAMSGTAGKVLLANIATAVSSPTAAEVKDLVGFGTATAFEGAVAPAPSNSNAIFRANNGCADTDNNAADFSAAAAAPRNTASPLNACGGTPPVDQLVVSCPATLVVNVNVGGSAALSAMAPEGIVNSITHNGVSGINLNNAQIPGSNGGTTTLDLMVAASVPAGTYPVTVTFNSTNGVTDTCTIAVTVQAASAVTRSISEIQGSAAASSLVGTVQTTEGVVTHKVSNGFYMQDQQGDGNPETSDGIFVFTGATANTIATGQKVRVTGTVAEFVAGDASRPVTQLASVSKMETLGSGFSITPTNVSMPLAHQNEMEKYEGMLVRFASPMVVAQNYFLGRYGQLTLASSRPEQPTSRFRPNTPEAIALAASNAASMIILDDNSSTQNPNPMPFIGVDNTVRAGDSVANLTGVIDFGLSSSSNPGPSSYKVQPVITPSFSRDNPRSAAPEAVGGNIKVASFNVLNYFTTFTDGTTFDGQTNQGCSMGSTNVKSNCRGASNLNEFNRQRTKTIAAMKVIDADVFGLMEMHNNGNVAVGNLVDGLNAATAPGTYAYVPAPVGQTGDDAIRVAFIYKPAKIGLVGASMGDTDPINSRPTLAQTFSANGQKFTLVVNHFKSKGSCPSDGSLNTDQGDGQGCWNALRVQQSQRLINHFIPAVKAATGSEDVLIIGDLNANGQEDPIHTITSAGYVSEIERFVRPHGMPYSFVFDGQSGYLDHALSSPSLSPKVTGTTEWHANADEPTAIDYNTEFRVQDLYSATPYRASDHDPVIVGLNLQAAYADITAQIQRYSSGLVYNRTTKISSGTVTLTNNGADVNGPFQLEISGLPTGVTLANASGMRNGVPYITITASKLATGQAISVPVSFNNPNRVNISYTSKVFSGSFN